jgi:hypothetical protein
MIGNLEATRQSVADAQDDAVRAVVRASADAAEGACADQPRGHPLLDCTRQG